MKYLVLIFVTTVVYLMSCSEPTKPVLRDGAGTLNILVLWDSTGSNSVANAVPVVGANVYLRSEYGMSIYMTGADGIARCEHLPSSLYSAAIQSAHPSDVHIQLVASVEKVEIIAESRIMDTVFVRPVPRSGIVINEIYSAGPVNSIFYFYDQFIELYNASDEVKYLDGMIVMRVSGNNDGKGPGADEGDDGDMDGVTYAFKFPGQPGQKNYPIKPGQFVVLASDAVDHRKAVGTSIDLSHADWEFYNQYSAEDIDNPNVPNLINIRSDRTQDFLINLMSDVIVISTGEDSVWQDGIDFSTIVDGVEYQSNPPPTAKKTLDPRVDRGYVLSPPRYSGMSIQRRQPGYDTNNATVDFEINPKPTPGWQ